MPGTAGRCPRCQGANACALAAGQDVVQCWCRTAHFPAGGPPPQLKDEACICHTCLEALTEVANPELRQAP